MAFVSFFRGGRSFSAFMRRSREKYRFWGENCNREKCNIRISDYSDWRSVLVLVLARKGTSSCRGGFQTLPHISMKRGFNPVGVQPIHIIANIRRGLIHQTLQHTAIPPQSVGAGPRACPSELIERIGQEDAGRPRGAAPTNLVFFFPTPCALRRSHPPSPISPDTFLAFPRLNR